MFQINKLVYLIFVMVAFSCSQNNTPNNNFIPLDYEETIDISNYSEVLFNERMLKIGTPRYHYIKGENSQIVISNLPLNGGYQIKINGKISDILAKNGVWIYENKETNSTIRKSTIELTDIKNDALLREVVEYEVRELNPFIESEYGQYLIKGFPANLAISNLAVTCPHIKLEAKGGKVIRTKMGAYNIIPDDDVDTVNITMNYNGLIYKKEFKTIKAPLPHITFSSDGEMKCIALTPIGLYPNLNYTIKKIVGHSFLENKEIQIIKKNCYIDNNQFFVKEIIYSINETGYIDTIRLN